MGGFSCQPVGYGKSELHNLVPPIRIEPFLKDTRLCPVYHLVRLEKSLVKLRPQSETRFWLPSRKPYKMITSITMCRYGSTAVQAYMDMKRVMEAAKLAAIINTAEALLQAAEPPAVDEYFKCYQLVFWIFFVAKLFSKYKFIFPKNTCYFSAGVRSCFS